MAWAIFDDIFLQTKFLPRFSKHSLQVLTQILKKFQLRNDLDRHARESFGEGLELS
jgi:hypothetical protein